MLPDRRQAQASANIAQFMCCRPTLALLADATLARLGRPANRAVWQFGVVAPSLGGFAKVTAARVGVVTAFDGQTGTHA